MTMKNESERGEGKRWFATQWYIFFLFSFFLNHKSYTIVLVSVSLSDTHVSRYVVAEREKERRGAWKARGYVRTRWWAASWAADHSRFMCTPIANQSETRQIEHPCGFFHCAGHSFLTRMFSFLAARVPNSTCPACTLRAVTHCTFVQTSDKSEEIISFDISLKNEIKDPTVKYRELNFTVKWLPQFTVWWKI